ncbi:hypothetical protein V7182_18905 [Neobacillus drentensis]|uniref:hypothetical protein n=1 Tax=Neobacillus drentensis TaxID=220684 RepID=UPI002FFE61E0
MQQFITNNIVSIISVLTAITIAVVTYLKTKHSKELSYSVLSSTSLLIKDEGLQNRIKLLVDGEEVKGDVNLVLLKLINTGNVPIKPDDFIEELSIETSASIIVAEVKETNPPNLSVKLDNAIGDIFGITSVQPTLLNPKDEITFKLLVKSYKNDLVMKGRIVGVQKINKLKKKFPIGSIILSFAATVIMILLARYGNDKGITKYFTYASSLLTAMAFSATLLAMFETWKSKKNQHA